MSLIIIYLIGRKKGTLMNIFGYFRQRHKINQTFKALSALSDRDLKDIGINRSDIFNVARSDS